MNTKFSTLILVGFGLLAGPYAYAQETKIKKENGDYELKIKQDGDEYKLKEKGVKAAASPTLITTHKEGETVTTVKKGEMPAAQNVAADKKPVAKKRSYASRKVCTCKTAARKKTPAKRQVAYRPKKKTTTSSATVASVNTSPVVVTDTVFITRVDTVFSMNESASFTGYRTGKAQLIDDYKKLKIEKEKDGSIKMKKEYENGSKVIKEFDNKDDFNTYLEWKNY
jgi:hypothetical protein